MIILVLLIEFLMWISCSMLILIRLWILLVVSVWWSSRGGFGSTHFCEMAYFTTFVAYSTSTQANFCVVSFGTASCAWLCMWWCWYLLMLIVLIWVLFCWICISWFMSWTNFIYVHFLFDFLLFYLIRLQHFPLHL